jgi:hypothetical protein
VPVKAGVEVASSSAETLTIVSIEAAIARADIPAKILEIFI